MADDKEKKSPNSSKRFFAPQKDKASKDADPGKSSGWRLAAKIVLCVLAVFVSLLILGLVFIDSVLHFAVTTVGSSLTGTRITLDEIELSFTRGDFKLANLQISNPEGFNSPSMVELGSFYISIDKSSLTTKDIVINDIQLHKLLVTADVNSSGKLNFLKVVENLVPAPKSSPAAAMLFHTASIAGGTVSAQPMPPGTKNSIMSPRVWVKNIDVTDIRFNWNDERKKFNINKFGASLKNINGSLTGGNIQVDDIQVFNPERYEKKHLLSLDSVKVVILPETIYTSTPVIKSVDVQGMNACAEFDKSSNFNVLDIVDSLQNALQPQNDGAEKTDVVANKPENNDSKTEEPATPSPAETREVPETAPAEQAPVVEPELQRFTLTGSSFTIYNDMLKLPIMIPLAFVKDDISFSVSVDDVDIFSWLHEHAVMLRDLCLSVTDAKDLLMQMVNSSTESGIKFLDTTAKGGAELINDTTKAGIDLLDKTAKGGIDVVNKSGAGGKKALKKVIDIFK